VRRDKDKRPVLTSPWKIGMFVALMLVVIAFGVGYYMTSTYNISLKWLSIGADGWKIDSFLFFREMYPLVAGVVILALLCYFIIASAVRRYKYYLDSGQDYRKMISLAESIDDLTNPAQIAKLSDYPELQNVLRNYGDQIREISKEIEETKEKSSTDELENYLVALDAGEKVDEGEINDRWWYSLYQKVKDYINRRDTKIEQLREESSKARTVSAEAALLSGKLKEHAKEIADGIKEIEEALAGVSSTRSNPGDEQVAGSTYGNDSVMALLSDMEGSTRRLKEITRSFNEFSNENNNLALSLALMAAKGQVAENELAQLAEKMRGSAEGFNKLSRTVDEVADFLTQTLFSFRENLIKVGPPTSKSPTFSGEAGSEENAIVELVQSVRSRIDSFIRDVVELENLLQSGVKVLTSLTEDASTDGDGKVEGNIERDTVGEVGSLLKGELIFEEQSPSTDSQDLVIERSTKWDDSESEVGGYYDTSSISDSLSDSFDEGSVKKLAKDADMLAEVEPQSPIDNIEAGEERKDSDNKKILEKEAEKEASTWMEMPGHRWVQVDVEHSEDATSGINVQHVESDVSQIDEREDVFKPESGTEGLKKEDITIGQKNLEPSVLEEESVEDEPVYDLFELGAVEVSGGEERL